MHAATLLDAITVIGFMGNRIPQGGPGCGFEHPGFSPVMAAQQIGSDTKEPGTGVRMIQIVTSQPFLGDKEDFTGHVICRKLSCPSGGVPVNRSRVPVL